MQGLSTARSALRRGLNQSCDLFLWDKFYLQSSRHIGVMPQNSSNNVVDDFLMMFFILCGLLALGAYSASQNLGDCPTTASSGATMTEGLVIVGQIAILVGGFIILSLIILSRITQSLSVIKNPLWSLFGLSLVGIGIYVSNYLLSNYSGTATCVDGLFHSLPF